MNKKLNGSEARLALTKLRNEVAKKYNHDIIADKVVRFDNTYEFRVYGSNGKLVSKWICKIETEYDIYKMLVGHEEVKFFREYKDTYLKKIS